MSIWRCIPSARPTAEANLNCHLWKLKGYKIALLRDEDAEPLVEADLCMIGKYPGYAIACNALIDFVLRYDHECMWVHGGGDDIRPDEKSCAVRLERELTDHFRGTFGVMQPTGDQYMQMDGTVAAERVCISPYIGRDACRRLNMGTGPWWHGYFHFFVDEELHNVAVREGILWHRPDLCEYHDHWTRHARMGRPRHLDKVGDTWVDAKAYHEKRKAGGYPGSEVLP